MDNSPKNAFWQLYCLAHGEKSRCTFRSRKNSDNSLNGPPKARQGELCFPHRRESKLGCWVSPEESRLGSQAGLGLHTGADGSPVRTKRFVPAGETVPTHSMPEISREAVQAAGVQTPLTLGVPAPGSSSAHVPLSSTEATPADGLRYPDVVTGKSCQGLLAGVSFSPVRLDIFSV